MNIYTYTCIYIFIYTYTCIYIFIYLVLFYLFICLFRSYTINIVHILSYFFAFMLV